MHRGDLAQASKLGVEPRPATCNLPDGFQLRGWKGLDLDGLQASWSRLADRASTPNAFFEAGFLVPSLSIFDREGEVSLALLVEGGQLRGMMPCTSRSDYHGRRLPHSANWLHANMFCGVPLVEAGYEEAFWTAYLATRHHLLGSSWFVHFSRLPADCTVTRALETVCLSQQRQMQIVHREARAVLNRGSTPETHLAQTMTPKARKELRRQRRRLDELGTVEIVRSRSQEGLQRWIEEFLMLETKGWKGESGSSLASNTHTTALFIQALTRAAEQGRLERLSLTLEGKPIAMLATLLAPPGSFSFKTAFDEDYARYSPGMQLQVENLALLDDPDLVWCDSCAAEGHPMIERIWRDTREMVSITVEAGSGWRRQLGNLWARIEAWRMEQRR